MVLHTPEQDDAPKADDELLRNIAINGINNEHDQAKLLLISANVGSLFENVSLE